MRYLGGAKNRATATEVMNTRIVSYGFVDLKLARITGIASLQNDASQRVLRKIGLERRGERAFGHADYASEARWRGSNVTRAIGWVSAGLSETCRIAARR
jgi:RimJ/RimL family protein N-acetyltransferase